MGMDIVLMTLTPCRENNKVKVLFWIVPSFVRRGMCYDDLDILNAVRVMLTIKSVVNDDLQRQYRKRKRFDTSGALPRQCPSFWGPNAQPCTLYTLLASGRLRASLGDLVSMPEIFSLVWNVIVPERCPRCDEVDIWALLSERTALCYGCNFTVDV